MTTYLIDAYNVLHRLTSFRTQLVKDPESARASLIRQCRLIYGRQTHVVAVFDGSGHTDSSGGIRVVFSGKSTADQLIKKLIDEEKHRQDVVVVTSDAEIQRYAKNSGCRFVSAETFPSLVRSSPEETLDEKSNPKMSDKDIQEWMDLFSDRPE